MKLNMNQDIIDELKQTNKQLIDQHEEIIDNLRIELTEHPDGSWEKFTYDQNNNEIKFEDSDGVWEEHTYNQNNQCIKTEHSDGYWEEYTYDQNNKLIKFEDSNGFCYKQTYD